MTTLRLKPLLEYTPILFDFDGLLVNTEKWHFEAYKQLIESFECPFNWTFSTFLPLAHESSDSISLALQRAYPEIFSKLPWCDFYKKKSEYYCKLIETATIELMPGADKLLRALIRKGSLIAVVTNSSKKQIDLIKSRNPLLSTIKHWFVREDYNRAKPAPDGYLKAIETLGTGEPIIGFEDSKKGILSLIAAGVTPVLICDENHAKRQGLDPSIPFFPSLSSYMETTGL